MVAGNHLRHQNVGIYTVSHINVSAEDRNMLLSSLILKKEGCSMELVLAMIAESIITPAALVGIVLAVFMFILLVTPSRGCFIRVVKFLLSVGCTAVSGYIVYLLLGSSLYQAYAPVLTIDYHHVSPLFSLALASMHPLLEIVPNKPLNLLIPQSTLDYIGLLANIVTIIEGVISIFKQLSEDKN